MRRPLTASVAVAGLLALLAGCGGDGAESDVEAAFAAYIDRRGLDLELADAGCQSGASSGEGLELYLCTVHPAGGTDAETWNVAYDDELDVVVDASRR